MCVFNLDPYMCVFNVAGHLTALQVRLGLGHECEAPANENGEGSPPQRRGRGSDRQKSLK